MISEIIVPISVESIKSGDVNNAVNLLRLRNRLLDVGKTTENNLNKVCYIVTYIHSICSSLFVVVS